MNHSATRHRRTSPVRSSPLATSHGFTLIEMLISMTIFAVITGFVTANLSQSRSGDELRLSAQLVASSIRRVQSYSLSGQLVKLCADNSGACPRGQLDCPGLIACRDDLPKAYGVRFSPIIGNEKRIVFFADQNENGIFDDGEEFRTDAISSGRFVTVTSTSIGTTALSGALDIVFFPPKSAIKFNGEISETTAKIVLRQPRVARDRTVTVNRISGQVNSD
ncbi:hypothetical protein A3C96_00615 [Candidatus Uhrbacteria bacterium RIFCSPHIGHO2_02_FULL_60_10]|uniref:General secretion pathway GspH domain-containing protein n=1 Tax=Candidatus Uhrbacteria bacterium RIFCSPHIGHO2_02_FULL_60_10 TaxID=1802392 RepID=A0A1F7UBL8_9BACT|nr:MAG: hypothetical protein A3C96_00615 [Candidatus Uhrbacteria bacterium RIFCSPHIGHO2_02_FULL_60_10]